MLSNARVELSAYKIDGGGAAAAGPQPACQLQHTLARSLREESSPMAGTTVMFGRENGTGVKGDVRSQADACTPPNRGTGRTASVLAGKPNAPYLGRARLRGNRLRPGVALDLRSQLQTR